MSISITAQPDKASAAPMARLIGAAELERGLDILLTWLTTILTRQAKSSRPRQHGTRQLTSPSGGPA